MTTDGVPVDEQPIQVGNTDLSKVFKAKDGTEWSSTPETTKQKTPSKNIFKPPRTKINNAQSAVDPESTFNMFLPASIITDIVKYTNLEGDRVHGESWKPTDVIEVRALIGAYIYLGAMNQNIFPSELIWDVNNGTQSIRCTFTRNRFLKLGNMFYLMTRQPEQKEGAEMYLHQFEMCGRNFSAP
jgi:Transposase IS4